MTNEIRNYVNLVKEVKEKGDLLRLSLEGECVWKYHNLRNFLAEKQPTLEKYLKELKDETTTSDLITCITDQKVLNTLDTLNLGIELLFQEVGAYNFEVFTEMVQKTLNSLSKEIDVFYESKNEKKSNKKGR